MFDRLGTFEKTPAERKRYSIYYGDWLDTDETISSAAFAVTPELVTPGVDLAVDEQSIDTDGVTLVFYVSAGVDLVDYTINVKATSSGGQIKEDELVVLVRELT